MQFASLFLIRGLKTSANHCLKQGPSSIFGKSSTTLYSHVAQIGDPVLRKVSQPVNIDRISSSEIQNIIKQMRIMLKKYEAFGISAPQIGVPLRMFALQVTENQRDRGMEEIPFKVFINPEIKYIGNEVTVAKESCTSINGFVADVSRHKCVNVSYYDENGNLLSLDAKYWSARLIQHEIDHLNGILFTDKMHTPESLEFKYWKMVNSKNGDFRLPFGGLPGWKQYYYCIPILMIIPLLLGFEIYNMFY